MPPPLPPLSLLRNVLMGAYRVPVKDIERDSRLLAAMRSAGRNRDVVYQGSLRPFEETQAQVFTSPDPLFAGMFGDAVNVLTHPNLKRLPAFDPYRYDMDPLYEDVLQLLDEGQQLPRGVGPSTLRALGEARALGGIRTVPNRETLFLSVDTGSPLLRVFE